MSPRNPPQEETPLTAPRRRKRWLAASLLLVVALLAAWFEPTRCVRGVLCGEPFYGGRPASYWAQEWEPLCVMSCVRGDKTTPFPALDELENDPPEKLDFALLSRGTLWDRVRETFHRTFMNPRMPNRPIFLSPISLPPFLAGNDPNVLPMLESLQNHESRMVRLVARYGIQKLRTVQGPTMAKKANPVPPH